MSRILFETSLSPLKTYAHPVSFVRMGGKGGSFSLSPVTPSLGGGLGRGASN